MDRSSNPNAQHSLAPDAGNPSSGLVTTPPHDILSEAELGLMWLQRRTELVRLEIQTIELDLAIQRARSGETDSLLSWLRKNGTPWQDHLPTHREIPPPTESLTHPTAYVQPPSPAPSLPPKPRSQKKPYLQSPPNTPTTTPPNSSPTSNTPTQQPNISQPKISQPTPSPQPTQNLTNSSQPVVANSPTAVAPKPLPTPQPKPKPVIAPKPSVAPATSAAKPVKRTVAKKSPTTPQRKKTKQIPSWMVSTLVHAALLVLLMVFTIPLPEQKQILGLSGTFEPLQATPLNLDNTATEEAKELENHELTAAIPEADSLEKMLQDSLPSASDIAQNSLPGPDIASSLAPASATGLGQIENALDSKFIDQLSSTNSLAAANFFGLEATGNIFCFIVDCSGSMRGEPFVATKNELLKTISQFKPNQRFCVFFFNQKLFPMVLEEDLPAAAVPAADTFRPVAAYATPENLVRLQRWMDTVPIGTGGPPNQALKLAIELEPDSIFLLTDGVTRSDVAGNLIKTNRQEDELDGPQIRCPIHTIGFYSTEGEALLQRIAAENGGQYRYVPNPKPPKKSKKMEGGT